MVGAKLVKPVVQPGRHGPFDGPFSLFPGMALSIAGHETWAHRIRVFKEDIDIFTIYTETYIMYDIIMHILTIY